MNSKRKQLLSVLIIFLLAIVNSGCSGGSGGSASDLLQPVTSTLGSILSTDSSASLSPSSQGTSPQTAIQMPNPNLADGAQAGANLGTQALQTLSQAPQDVLGTANRLATAPLQVLSGANTGQDSTN